jgi:D-serine deaminase-like pyridoxal phosphate-dependent protein
MVVTGIDTPAILIDLDRVEQNLHFMQQKADQFDVALRPHIKSHKIPELALRQLSLGARGICASKVSEAEVMVQAGIMDIFVANQVVAADKLKRLLEVGRQSRVAIGLDSLEGAKRLSAVFAAADQTVDVLIEINSGLNRCGVLPGSAAVELYQAIRSFPGLRLKGIFTHAGHVYGRNCLEDVKAVSREESRIMRDTARAFEAVGVQPEIVSVGSTPTTRVWEGEAAVNEIRPGNYIFLDAIQVALGVAKVEECALTVLATVISRPARDRAVIDAGSKVFALDKCAHGIELIKGFGIVLDRKAVLERLSEEHGVLALDPDETLAVGEQIRIIPNHACTVINLFDSAYGIRNGRLETVFRIAARGKVQ